MTALAGVDEIRVPVESDQDIVAARQKGRALAVRLGFSSSEATMVATAISELARNIVLYADRGEMCFRPRVDTARIQSWSSRPATRARASPMSGRRCRTATRPSGRLGVGLPGVKRLMDEFEISSIVGHGTVVVVKKWKE
jgi:serine/threonine-protein kinase RsbT